MEIKYDNTYDSDKRFLCFGSDDYYPQGGMLDMLESFDDILDALEWCKLNKSKYDDVSIYDRKVGKEINLDRYGI